MLPREASRVGGVEQWPEEESGNAPHRRAAQRQKPRRRRPVDRATRRFPAAGEALAQGLPLRLELLLRVVERRVPRQEDGPGQEPRVLGQHQRHTRRLRHARTRHV